MLRTMAVPSISSLIDLEQLGKDASTIIHVYKLVVRI